ncbi:MAG: TonB-dependent receptor [Candidatus Omnitrophica bacterium]|nr:TonB-dependent receptor [Candidatus Omnitrophota bacterium]
MKKILMCLAISIVVANIAFADENKREENLLEKFFEAAMTPMETVLGPVVDLGQIIITPTKNAEKLGAASLSVTPINVEDAVKNGQIKVEEALRNVSGADVVENGTNGPTSVFIRGANSNHTLVLLDGVKLYNPISTNGAFDFTDLTLDNLERIEVLRGSQSALYGSDAMGGVINIETKKCETNFVNASFESGSYYTTNESFAMGAHVNRLHYTFGGSQFNTKGISQAEAKNNNPEIDPYDRTSFSARLDYDITDRLTAGGTFRYTLSHFKYDNFGVDYPNLHASHENYIFTHYIEQELFDWWKYKINMGWMVNFNRDFDDIGGPNTNYQRDNYFGKSFTVDYQNTFKILDFDRIVIGYNHMEELGHSYYNIVNPSSFLDSVSNMPKATARNEAFYLENRFNYKDRLTATQGMRVDDHSYAGTHVTYKIDGSYLLPSATKIRGSVSTGFKAPTLYQLNAPSDPYFGGGNPNLKSETSFSYEYGLDQYLIGEKLTASVVYFQNRFENLIDTTTDPVTWYTSQYMNISKAYTYGVESELKFKAYDKLSGEISYTWMQTKDLSTDSELLRRAKNKVKAQLRWIVFPRFETNVIVRYTGPRMDTGQNKLKQYTTVDLTLNYELTKNFTAFVNIKNLFNKHYEEVRLYGEPGINAYGGVRAKF